ncbi:MAG: major capsid protein V20 domain-containing protein, partial [Candidatus Fonsibacter sp.]
MVVCVRKNIGSLTCSDTDSYATIKHISINFNNQAGLLSSMTLEQLYRHSVQSGLANMSWDEFSGSVISCCGYRNGGWRPHPYGPYKGVGANNERRGTTYPSVQYVPTTGTILVLSFAEVTTHRIQLQVTVENNQKYDWAGNEYE